MSWLKSNSSFNYPIQYNLWVKRIDTRFLKGGKDSVSLKSLMVDILDKAKEFELYNIRIFILNNK